MPQKNKFWEFRCTSNGGQNDSAELLLYGEIAGNDSWWRDVVSPRAFANELRELGDIKTLTVRIFSPGGDPFAAAAIYNLLRAHSAEKKVIIDGLAASAATVICMAGDEIEIGANSVFMIHDPSISAYGYYNSTEIAKMLEELEVVKSTIMAAYISKTGLDESEISSLMTNETWMDGKTAYEKGFATKLTESMDAGSELMNLVAPGDFKNYRKVPDEVIGYFKNRQYKNSFTKEKVEKNKKEREKMDIKNVAELKAAYPELTSELENAAAEAERERIRGIDDITIPGFEDTAAEAKFKTPCSAAEFALRIIAAQKKRGIDYLKNSEGDSISSGIGDVINRDMTNNSAIKKNEQNEHDESILDRVLGKIL